MDDTDLLAGPTRSADLLRAGVPRRRLAEMRRCGAVVQPVRGVLMPSAAGADPVARAAAVALVLPDRAAICRGVAAWVHGVDARPPWQRSEPLVLECVVPRGTEPPDLPGVVAHVDRLDHHDVARVGGVPVTTVERTALDLARTGPPHMALAALDALAHAGLVDVGRLAGRLDEWRGQRGVAQARRLVAWCEPLTESFGESWLRLRLLDAGFPRPTAQISVRRDGREVYRLDLGWPRRRLAVEYDGLDHHGTDALHARDLVRRQQLAREWGWEVLGVGLSEVLGRSLALERGVGEMLGLTPRTTLRTW
jgi:hypothetical protein